MADNGIENGSVVSETRASQKRTRELEGIAQGGDGSVEVDGNS